MLGNIDLERLSLARSRLAEIKNFKLAAVAPKHIGDPLFYYDVKRHLSQEVDDFANAYHQGRIDDALVELADVSNITDILAMIILDLQKKVVEKKGKAINLPSLFEEKKK